MPYCWNCNIAVTRGGQRCSLGFPFSCETGEAVTPSSGCVFCDLDLVPKQIGGKPMHPVDETGQAVPCTKQK